jgi:hypothetical protein
MSSIHGSKRRKPFQPHNDLDNQLLANADTSVDSTESGSKIKKIESASLTASSLKRTRSVVQDHDNESGPQVSPSSSNGHPLAERDDHTLHDDAELARRLAEQERKEYRKLIQRVEKREVYTHICFVPSNCPQG